VYNIHPRVDDYVTEIQKMNEKRYKFNDKGYELYNSLLKNDIVNSEYRHFAHYIEG